MSKEDIQSLLFCLNHRVENIHHSARPPVLRKQLVKVAEVVKKGVTIHIYIYKWTNYVQVGHPVSSLHYFCLNDRVQNIHHSAWATVR